MHFFGALLGFVLTVTGVSAFPADAPRSPAGAPRGFGDQGAYQRQPVAGGYADRAPSPFGAPAQNGQNLTPQFRAQNNASPSGFSQNGAR